MPVKAPPKKVNVVRLTEGHLNYYGLKPTSGKFNNQLEIELALFSRVSGSKLHNDGRKNEKGLPKWRHFANAVDLIWNYKGSPQPFMWHPWAITMAKAACRYKRLGVAGCGNSGKSAFFAVYAIVSWLANPKKNVVLVTTTTLKDSKGRIWGKISSYFNAMIAPPPGKIVPSAYEIKTVDQRTGHVYDEFGIRMFAGEASKSAESSRAIRGQKHGEGGKIIVILDEMPELGNAVVSVFEENITQNFNAQIIGLGNPNLPWDTFGNFCEPINGGYESITENDYEWDGKGGRVIRFDAELSPNILEGNSRYSFLMNQEQLDDKRYQMSIGRLSTRGYYRSVRGFWLLEADDETLYSPAELIRCPRECVWQGVPTKVAGFDPGYTSGGDRSVLTIFKVGVCTDGVRRVQIVKHYYLNEDLTKKHIDRTTQIVTLLRKICEDEGVLPENLGVDSTAGGGKTLCDVIWAKWSNRILRVDFGGKASDRPVSSADREKSSIRYGNRVSELWTAGKELLRCDQLRNVTKEAAEEMVIRRYRDTKAADGGSRIRVESKTEMKKRTQKSPDIADSVFIGIDVCRERHKLAGIEKAGNQSNGGKSPMQRRFSALSAIYNFDAA